MTRRANRYKFFRSPLRTYPYDERGNMTRTQRIPANLSVRDARHTCRCAIDSSALSHFVRRRNGNARGSRASSSPNGDRYAAHANQNVSQSSPPAVAAAGAGAGAADTAAGLRAGIAALARFGAASRSTRAAAGAGAAVGAEGARVA